VRHDSPCADDRFSADDDVWQNDRSGTDLCFGFDANTAGENRARRDHRRVVDLGVMFDNGAGVHEDAATDPGARANACVWKDLTARRELRASSHGGRWMHKCWHLQACIGDCRQNGGSATRRAEPEGNGLNPFVGEPRQVGTSAEDGKLPDLAPSMLPEVINEPDEIERIGTEELDDDARVPVATRAVDDCAHGSNPNATVLLRLRRPSRLMVQS
jgi:hypothetical protein